METFWFIAGSVWGVCIACAIVTPDTPFWRGYRDGMSLMPLWRLLGWRQ